MAQRRTWKLDEKLAVVLEVLKGQESVASICHRHGVAMAQVYRWRDAFIERGRLGLKDQRNPKHRDPVQEAGAARFEGGRVPEGHRLILRIDCGSQFVARRFREAAKALNVILEYAGIQCPEDKPYIESFFGHYKTEEVYRNAYTSLAEAQAGRQLYWVWYEAERIHQSLGYQTPQAVRHGALDLALSKAQNGTV